MKNFFNSAGSENWSSSFKELYTKMIKFANSELGMKAINCVETWDTALEKDDVEVAKVCVAQWEILEAVMRERFGLSFWMRRYENEFGIYSVTDQPEEMYFYKKMRGKRIRL